MLYPVRLALTHKAEANVFYNMWYGEGAGFLTSFFKEIYRNARYGGRTISLAYECRFERVVQQLCRPGELEAVSQCEQRIRALDHVQHAPAASDVLIIMGVPQPAMQNTTRTFTERGTPMAASSSGSFRLHAGSGTRGITAT